MTAHDATAPEGATARATPDAGGGPLAGVRVLDLSGYIAAPYGCTLLADQGADVIKIEPPQGDNLRKYPSTLASEGRAFLGVNRGKRALALNLKQPQGLAVLRRLVRDADVLVHNFRPAVPARLGMDYETLSGIHPRLIYCAISGYGETGPLKDRAGYDQVMQSMTGICAMQGSADAPEIVYGSVVDYYAAALMAAGVGSALYQREKTGVGQYVAISLLRSARSPARLALWSGYGCLPNRGVVQPNCSGSAPCRMPRVIRSRLSRTRPTAQEICSRRPPPRRGSSASNPVAMAHRRRRVSIHPTGARRWRPFRSKTAYCWPPSMALPCGWREYRGDPA
jgi:hypothetical protein